jgi:spore maturation protein CgeB
MKIQILTQYYTPYLNSFYLAHPKFIELSYNEMLNLLLNQFFADTGAAHYYFNLNGNESFIIIANCELLQKQWAIENDLTYSDLNWEKEIALAQIRNFKPDVFYIESIFSFYGAFIKEAKKFSKKVAAWISTPFTNDLPLNDIDIIFSSTPAFVKEFNKMGILSYYILPGFDERVLEKIKNPQPKTIDFSFVGGWSEVHVNRKLLLKQFVNKTPLQIWGYGYKKNFSKRSLNFYKNYLFPENKNILKHYHK